MSDDIIITHHILRNELKNRIIYELIEDPQKSISFLSQKLKTNQRTIQYHIKELETAGLIHKIHEGNSKFLRVRNEDLMCKILHIK